MLYCEAHNKAKRAALYGDKNNFERTRARKVKENPKSFWSYIRSKTDNKSVVADLKDKHEKVVSEDVVKENIK